MQVRPGQNGGGGGGGGGANNPSKEKRHYIKLYLESHTLKGQSSACGVLTMN